MTNSKSYSDTHGLSCWVHQKWAWRAVCERVKVKKKILLRCDVHIKHLTGCLWQKIQQQGKPARLKTPQPCPARTPWWYVWYILPLRVTQMSTVCAAAWRSIGHDATAGILMWAGCAATQGHGDIQFLAAKKGPCLGLKPYCGWELRWCPRSKLAPEAMQVSESVGQPEPCWCCQQALLPLGPHWSQWPHSMVMSRAQEASKGLVWDHGPTEGEWWSVFMVCAIASNHVEAHDPFSHWLWRAGGYSVYFCCDIYDYKHQLRERDLEGLYDNPYPPLHPHWLQASHLK